MAYPCGDLCTIGALCACLLGETPGCDFSLELQQEPWYREEWPILVATCVPLVLSVPVC